MCKATPTSIKTYYERKAAELGAKLDWELGRNDDRAVQTALDLANLSTNYVKDTQGIDVGDILKDYLKSDDYKNKTPEQKVNELLGLSLVTMNDTANAGLTIPAYIQGLKDGNQSIIEQAKGNSLPDPKEYKYTDPLLAQCARLAGPLKLQCRDVVAKAYFFSIQVVNFGTLGTQVQSSADGGGVYYYPLTNEGFPTGASAWITPGLMSSGVGTESDLEKYRPPGWTELTNPRAGHLIARMFGGSGTDPRNIASMEFATNNRCFAVLENFIRERVRTTGKAGLIVVPITLPGIFGGRSPQLFRVGTVTVNDEGIRYQSAQIININPDVRAGDYGCPARGFWKR